MSENRVREFESSMVHHCECMRRCASAFFVADITSIRLLEDLHEMTNTHSNSADTRLAYVFLFLFILDMYSLVGELVSAGCGKVAKYA